MENKTPTNQAPSYQTNPNQKNNNQTTPDCIPCSFVRTLKQSVPFVVFSVLTLFSVHKGWLSRYDWNSGALIPLHISLPLALAGALSFLLQPLPRWKILSAMGRNSLNLFGLHLITYSLFAAVWKLAIQKALPSLQSYESIFTYTWPVISIILLLKISPVLIDPLINSMLKKNGKTAEP